MKFVSKQKADQCDVSRCNEPPEYRIGAELVTYKRGVHLCGKHALKAVDEFGFDPAGAETIDLAAPPAGESPEALAERETAEAEAVLEQLEGYTIDTQEDLDFAAEVIAEVKGKWKALDEAEKAITKPMNAALKAARDLFRKPKGFYAQIEKTLKDSVKTWHLEEEARHKQAMLDAAEAHEAGDEQGRQQALARVGTVAQVDGLRAYTKYQAVIEDESLIPREYLMPNMKLIKEAGSHARSEEQLPKIPGIKWVPDAVVSSRSA